MQTVNARDLHYFLEVGSVFKDWIARRIADYGFEDGKDFCSFLSESSGGRPSKEYHLSLDMAKELSMVERNEKGKRARQYFIECERRAKDPPAALSDPTAMSGSSLAYDDRRYVRNATYARQRKPKCPCRSLSPSASSRLTSCLICIGLDVPTPMGCKADEREQ
nr:antA/AntB antirepressor family protein [Brucella sp. HL-2]